MTPADASADDRSSYGWGNWAGLVLGPLVFALLLALPAPEGLSAAGWRTAGVGLWMAIWWISEAAPIPATALLPLVLFPVLGVGGIDETASPYANPLIFLFMGGFILAIGMQRWGLHRRIALTIIRAIGTRPRAIVLGFMVATAFLSMWVSNTATAMMMLPIGLSVIEIARASEASPGAEKIHPEDSDAAVFAIVLMLGIAYAASIGGTGTIIGTPPNALLAGFLGETYGVDVGFAQWMLVGIPLVVVGLPLAYWVLTRVVFSLEMETLPGGEDLIEDELERLGPLTMPERRVGVVFGAVALMWMTRPLLERYVPGLSDAGIAMLGAVTLFLIPVDPREGTFLLAWEDLDDLPWGVLLLFGGGLSLAAAVERTGLAKWIGEALGAVGTLPVLLVILAVTAVIVLLTELTSNTATTAAFLPIMASVAVGIGENPFLLVVPAALAASCAFMLPVATPPNAIVYGSDVLRIPDMARAGAVLNLLFVLLVTALTYTLVLVVFDVQLGVVPGWVG